MNFIRLFVAGAALLLASTANSLVVTEFGTDVSFTYDNATFFGAGTISGNNIFFTPDAFLAQSFDGIGPADLVTDTLNIDVNATTGGFNLSSFLLIENGDYKLDGVGADVDATAFLQISSNTNVIGCGVSGFDLCQDTFLVNAGPLADTGGASALWSLGGNIDLSDTIGWEVETSVNITLQNNLLADTTSVGELAFIQKKFGVIGITVNPIPVPAAVWLFGSGLIALVGFAKRRQS